MRQSRTVSTSARRRRLATSLGAGLLLVVAAAGCSGDDEPEPAAEGSTAADEGTDDARVPPADLPEVPEIRQPVGAVGDLDLGECGLGPGEVSVEGEVTNSAPFRRDVLVVLSWTNDTSDVLARGVAVAQDVESGDSAGVTIDADVPEGATQCVPNVRRGVVPAG